MWLCMRITREDVLTVSDVAALLDLKPHAVKEHARRMAVALRERERLLCGGLRAPLGDDGFSRACGLRGQEVDELALVRSGDVSVGTLVRGGDASGSRRV